MTYLFEIVYFWLVYAVSDLTRGSRYAILELGVRFAGRSLTTKMKVELDYKKHKADEVEIEEMDNKDRVVIKVGNTVIDIVKIVSTGMVVSSELADIPSINLYPFDSEKGKSARYIIKADH